MTDIKACVLPLFVEIPATDALYQVSPTAQWHYHYQNNGIRLGKATISDKQAQQKGALQ